MGHNLCQMLNLKGNKTYIKILRGQHSRGRSPPESQLNAGSTINKKDEKPTKKDTLLIHPKT